MPSNLTPLTAAMGIADGLLALAAMSSILRLLRQPCAASRPLVPLLGAGAVAGIAHACSSLIDPIAATVALGLAAVIAWVGTVWLWRAPSAPFKKEDDTPHLLELALAACGDGVMIASTNQTEGIQIVYSNSAFEHLTGYSPDEAVGLSPSIFVDEGDCLTTVRSALRGTEPVRVEVQGRRKDGARVWAEWQIVPVTDVAGQHTHAIAVLRDTTQRRRAEKALRESEARFRSLFEHAADGIFVLDQRGKILDANRQACLSFGYSHQDLMTRTLADLGVRADSPGSNLHDTNTVERIFQRNDGTFIAVEIRFALSECAGTRLNLAIVRDVTRRRQAEQLLREREELLRSIISHIPCGVFWKDRDSIYLGCNEQVARDYGLSSTEQVVGQSDYDMTHNSTEATFYRDCDRTVIESGQPILNLEQFHTRRDKTIATILTSKVPLRNLRGEIVGVLGVYTDITDRKRLEEQFRQAQKMEAVGRLAGGIAHDFNNLLTVIRGNAELLRSPAETREPNLLDDLVLATDRATALVRQLLMFSKRQPMQVELLDLNEIVTTVSGLLRRLLGESISLVLELADTPVTVKADRSHLEQVVMNLAVNGRDAMVRGGTLTIATKPVERKTEGTRGQFAQLAITDTGTGMTDEVKGRIFEPFFTTKGQDKGTGLGLATVFGIVQQAGGHIEVESIPGAGTTFRVDLPWSEGRDSGSICTPAPRATLHRSAPQSISVLLVEDQDAVRKFARLTLESQGHQVIDVENGEAALKFAQGGGAFDVLISDITMPGIDGRELTERILALQPDVGVVLMSGYAPDSDRDESFDRAVFLQKPFPPADLLAALDKSLRLRQRQKRMSTAVQSAAVVSVVPVIGLTG